MLPDHHKHVIIKNQTGGAGYQKSFYSDEGGGTLLLQKQLSTLLRAYMPDFKYSAPWTKSHIYPIQLPTCTFSSWNITWFIMLTLSKYVFFRHLEHYRRALRIIRPLLISTLILKCHTLWDIKKYVRSFWRIA